MFNIFYSNREDVHKKDQFVCPILKQKEKISTKVTFVYYVQYLHWEDLFYLQSILWLTDLSLT